MRMTEIVVTFQTKDGSAEKTLNDVLLDSTLKEAREAVQMFLGLPENTPCQLVLERTNEVLMDNLTFREAGVKQGDKIILNYRRSHSGVVYVPSETSTSASPPSLVTYTFSLTILSDGKQPKNYDYPIELTDFYESNPQRFFSDYNAQERQNFIAWLQEIVPRAVQNFEIDKILRDWCDDISVGYRITALKI